MLPRAVFYPTLLYNMAMEKFAGRPWYNRIDETVILGALPFRSMTAKLVQDENVQGVVTLNEEFETRHFVNNREEWSQWGVEQLRLDTADWIAAPTQDKLEAGVSFIEKHRLQGNSVYVHCKAGRTRSATVVACYLIQEYKWLPEEAIEFIRNKRPHIVLRSTQYDAIKTFHDSLPSAGR